MSRKNNSVIPYEQKSSYVHWITKQKNQAVIVNVEGSCL